MQSCSVKWFVRFQSRLAKMSEKREKTSEHKGPDVSTKGTMPLEDRAYVMVLPTKTTAILINAVINAAPTSSTPTTMPLIHHVTLMTVPIHVAPKERVWTEYVLPKPLAVRVTGNAYLPNRDGTAYYTVITLDPEPCRQLCEEFGSQFGVDSHQSRIFHVSVFEESVNTTQDTTRLVAAMRQLLADETIFTFDTLVYSIRSK